MLPLDGDERRVISYPASAERYGELMERDGVSPAPYLARYHWVAVESWGTLRSREWEEELRRAHALVFGKLPTRVRATLALPAAERRTALREGQARRAAWEVKEAARKAAAGKRPGSGRSPMDL